MGNYILGGGGLSRLSQRGARKAGLSYSVYSYFAPGLHAGAFTIGLQTRPDQATQAVAGGARGAARGLWRRARRAGRAPTPPRDNLVGGFALRIDSNRKLLDNIAGIAWNGLPLDYLNFWTTGQQSDRGRHRAAVARKLQRTHGHRGGRRCA